MNERPIITMERWHWRIAGQVQGVGFRPWVYRVASGLGLTGVVWNDAAGVIVELQGTPAALHSFEYALQNDPPPLARVDRQDRHTIPVLPEEFAVTIRESQSGIAAAAVTFDAAVCHDCLRELLDPTDRRFGYGLLNCTHCGPRLSIIRRVPYDRANTTMAEFPLCDACAREYHNPADRRFHAQPTCCPRCGPAVEMVPLDGESRGRECDAKEPIDQTEWPLAVGLPTWATQAAIRLRAGDVLAIKGLGGFHLAVRADDEAAVQRLRDRKGREAKPFALMVPTLAAAEALVTLSEQAKMELASPHAPIVLATTRPTGLIASNVAPGTHRLGIMLPYAPIHHVLWKALGDTVPALVMTSANFSDEPLVTENREAQPRLAGLADAILWHHRPIQRPVDDSVLLDRGTSLLPLRRSRGYTPIPISLPGAVRSGLCLGGELKNTLAVVRSEEAILSQHLGDITNARAYANFRQVAADYLELFGVRPQFVACDLHPNYLSTQHARELAARWNVPLVPVQHHHAHAAALLAEHGHAGPALALVCDGTGYGPDGTIWGGELLRVEGGGYQRLGRLRPIRLPGGDAAAKETRRAGLSLLHLALGDAFADTPQARALVADTGERAMLSAMIRRGVNSPWTSSTGRVFDGVAALLGLCPHNAFEAQAAMALEQAAAAAVGELEDAPFWTLHDAEETPAEAGDFAPPRWELNVGTLVIELLRQQSAGVPVESIARFFHEQLASGFAAMVELAHITTGLPVVGLSGGVAVNSLLSQALATRLEAAGMTVLHHRLVPPNDGGLSLGQAAIAARSTG